MQWDLGHMQGRSYGTFYQRNLRKLEAPKAPNSFRAEEYWLCQCIWKVQGRSFLVASQSPGYEIPYRVTGV